METDYIKVYTGSMVVVQLLIDKLQEIGISPIIKDEMESGRLAGFGASIPFQQELYVHQDEIDKTVPVVQAALAEIEA